MSETGNGRGIDLNVGVLEAEAAQQRSPEHRAGAEGSPDYTVWRKRPAEASGSYYERPVLKEPVWIWAVPAYFYAGGAAGAAAALGAAAQLTGSRKLRKLVKRCRGIALGGAAAGTVLLIYDLGRPERFLNMLRVFRPTSPLNLGSWLLANFGSMSGAAVVLSGPAGNAAGLASGALGLPLTSYTAAVLSNSAIPAWNGARKSLPFLFAASSLSSACDLLELTDLDESEEAIVRRAGLAAMVGELVAAAAVEKEVSKIERVGRPYKEGVSGSLWRAATGLGIASLILSLVPGRGAAKRKASALVGTAGALALRFSLLYVGKASARDPHATFEQQRGT